jgi:hypothetical protein
VAAEIGGIHLEIATFNTRVPKRGAKSGRRLASVDAPGPEETQDRREAWMEWGENTLKRTQWAKDTLENDRRGRKAVPALDDAGLSLVSFHGYVEQGKWRKANAELDHAEASLKKARKLACDVPTPRKHRKKHASHRKRK